MLHMLEMTMLQVYILNVSSGLDVCCNCFTKCYKSRSRCSCGESLRHWWSSSCDSLLWRRWRPRTQERQGWDAAADRPGWARARRIEWGGTRASIILHVSGAGAGRSVRTIAAFGAGMSVGRALGVGERALCAGMRAASVRTSEH
jgi:hypothetical protein